MDDYKDNFKYKAILAILKKSMSVKTKEAISWRRSAKRYLKDFEHQFEYRNLPTWKIDDELFDSLQREAQKILIDL